MRSNYIHMFTSLIFLDFIFLRNDQKLQRIIISPPLKSLRSVHFVKINIPVMNKLFFRTNGVNKVMDLN